MSIDETGDRDAICEVKARYCRLLDGKRWDEWATLFTEDFVLDTSAAGGPPPITGRDAALASARSVIETARTVHQVHSPEIEVGHASASAVWAMQDRLIFADGMSLTGYGHYHETYRKQDGTWRIATSRLTRLIVDVTPPDVPPGG